MTAPLARVAAQFRNDLPSPYRRYTMGPVWRNEKPGPGRFRQFYQCDADTVGAASVAADAEICAMLAETLEAVGIPRGDYIVRVNNRKVLNGVLEVAGLSGEEKERQRGIVFRAIDKLDKFGPEGVRLLLGDGRLDDSGDFTEGAGLSESQIEIVMRFVFAKSLIVEELDRALEQIDSSNRPGVQNLTEQRAYLESPSALGPNRPSPTFATDRVIDYLRRLVGSSEVGRQGVEELQQISYQLYHQGYGPDRIVIDPSVVRGLGYYTGPVYEAELTFEITDEKGRPRQFGSVAGGGRYDDLVKRFTGQEVPATGISIGVDRLLAALRAKGRIDGTARGPVVVTVMDRERMAEYQAMASELRAAGIRAEVYLGNPKNFGNQLKYADKRASPVAVIQGSDEAAAGKVQLKDLILGAKLAEGATLEEWKSQPAQTEVDRADLVAGVKALLDRHR
jgi:histidyl-tRNA synthetase